MDDNLRIKTIIIGNGKPTEYATARTQRREGLRVVIDSGKTNPWNLLHDGTVRDRESLAKWELLIPRYGCACRKDYLAYKAANPPDFTSPESLWVWGFNLHNWVNRKLGKPEITIEEAQTIWRRNDEQTKDSGSDLP